MDGCPMDGCPMDGCPMDGCPMDGCVGERHHGRVPPSRVRHVERETRKAPVRLGRVRSWHSLRTVSRNPAPGRSGGGDMARGCIPVPMTLTPLRLPTMVPAFV
ncbi:hypothetical protein [Rhodocista pekingensis]|uniref:Uncharacterized protein n=1 Tax=Rhodocista pekingensis TaxID=201185 RepID=A0ABW2KUA9_9PROT